MNKEEALELMKDAPKSKTRKSKPFLPMTEFQAFNMIQKWLDKLLPEHKIKGVLKKRVWQVVKNQHRPRYDKS